MLAEIMDVPEFSEKNNRIPQHSMQEIYVSNIVKYIHIYVLMYMCVCLICLSSFMLKGMS